jgi:hypothetical protein
MLSQMEFNRKADRKGDQEMMGTHDRFSSLQDGHQPGTNGGKAERSNESNSAIEEKMEAIVHSTRSERDKIQRRNENVTGQQGIPNEGAIVASQECEGQGHKELEFGAERQLVPAEEVARKSSITKKRPGCRHMLQGDA